jgi:hypothetical protein
MTAGISSALGPLSAKQLTGIDTGKAAIMAYTNL